MRLGILNLRNLGQEEADQDFVKIVDALKVILHLRVVVLNHADQFINSHVFLTTFHKDSELPSTALYPELKTATTLPFKECLGLVKCFLGKEQFEVQLGEADWNWSVLFVALLVCLHKFFGKCYGKLECHGRLPTTKPLL